jgi:hypothetical protein
MHAISPRRLCNPFSLRRVGKSLSLRSECKPFSLRRVFKLFSLRIICKPFSLWRVCKSFSLWRVCKPLCLHRAKPLTAALTKVPFVWTVHVEYGSHVLCGYERHLSVETTGQMYIVFCRPLLPPATTAVFGSNPSSLFSKLILYHRCGLAYPYEGRGFVGLKKRRLWAS